MSGAAVRAAVATYLTAAAIPQLTQVFADPPFDMEDVPWDTLTPAGQTNAAVGLVFLDSDNDEVIGLDGAGGRRKVTYEVSFEVLAWDVSGTAATAQASMDDLLDAVKARLRTDPALGTTPIGNGDIIQAAFSRLFVDRGRPVRPGEGDAWACWAAVRFAVETYEYST